VRIAWSRDLGSRRTQLYHRVREFMRDHEFLILLVNQVPPFDVKQRYLTEIAGQRMETYIDWMKSCYYITVHRPSRDFRSL